jgi:hypothetical protein
VKRLFGLVSVLIAGLVALLLFGAAQPVANKGFKGKVARQAAQGTLRAPVMTIRRNGTTTQRTLPFISAGTARAAQDAIAGVSARDERAEAADKTATAADQGFPDIGQAEGTMGCSRRDRSTGSERRSGDQGNSGGANVRVNQDCTFRRQAETEITYNPANPSNLVAGQNDSRVGYNQCGIDWSLDSGTKWGDLLPPFRQRTNSPETMGPNSTNPNDNTINGGVGTGHTYDAGSDPALAVDSQGRSYFSCVTFDVNSNASGLYVTQSPRGADGSFYYNVPDQPAKRFMVVEDNSGLVFHDKNFIAADYYKNSPNRDNVYVTWTVFKFGAGCLGGSDTAPTQCESPIFGSMSSDHGITWSTPEEISGASDTLCFFGNFLDPTKSPHSCNFDQGSDPVVLPNGDLQVIFNNENTSASNPNSQQLGVHCRPTGSSTNGTAHLRCAGPSKVGDDVTTGEPACDFGRGPEECIPGPFIRTNDFPRIVTENSQNNHLYAVWQDYRNQEFDIQLSRSTDGGLTWHEAGTLNPDRGLDHYMPAVDQSPTGNDRVGSSYYRSERVANESADPAGLVFAPCEANGQPPAGSDSCAGVAEGDSDYVLAGGTAASVPFAFQRVSPVFPPPDGAQAGFNGDYSGLTINRGVEAHPFWSDTRNVDPYTPANGVVHDEDGFTQTLSLPNGRGGRGQGQIGKN